MDRDEASPSLLANDAIEYLRRRGVEAEHNEGTTLLRRGEVGKALWVVIRGEVEIRVASGDGHHFALTRRGPREAFGELSIFRSAPASADVVAVTPVRVLEYPAEYLPTALAECESLRHSLLTRMAHNLHEKQSEVIGFQRQSRALAELYRGGLPTTALIAESARMRVVKSRIEKYARTPGLPVLVSGEDGTGKLLVTRMIHAASGRGGEPLIAVECRELNGRDANALLFGTSSAQEHGDMEACFGALHLAHGGTLVLRGIDALDRETQRELAHHIEAEREVEQTPFPNVRLITTWATPGEVRPPDVVDELREQMKARIHLPPLAERPRDILPLARLFLSELEGGEDLVLMPSAEQALVSLKYRRRNVDELKSVVELAARVADGGEIRAEHVFSGFDDERPIGIDVSRFWLVRWLVAGGGMRLTRLAVAAGFFSVAGLCMWAGSSALGRAANGAVWSLWEPVVFGLFLLVGSLWCTVCPLSSTGRFVQRFFTLGRPPPAWLTRAGGWISAAGFVLILWSEEVFDMAHQPAAAAWLLLALVAGAVVSCLIWKREVWCRSLCPLGRLGVALAPVAPVTVAARRSVCVSRCTTHDCYKGNEQEMGCPVFHHPQLVGESHHCKTCMTCLRSCPHGSTGLYLRPRLRSAWHLVSAESYVVPFALTVFLLGPVLIVAQRGGRLAHPLWLTLACIATIAGAAVLSRILPPLVQGRAGRSSAFYASISCALLVLGWGPLMAYQMDHIPLLHSLSIVAEEGSVWAAWPGSELSALYLIRIAFVIFAATLSAITLWNARGHTIHSGEPINIYGWTTVVAGCTLYTALSLWLV